MFSVLELFRCVRGSMGLVAVVAAAVLLVGGCSGGQGKPGADGEDDHRHPHGDHPTVGPHGGQIIEWGDHEYHVEITFDRDKQQATVYILDHDVKKPEPVAVSTPLLKLEGLDKAIPLTPSPLDGESGGKSSRYVATDAALAASEKFTGVVTGTVGETPYFGEFKEGDAKKGGGHDEDGGHDEHDEHDEHGDHDEDGGHDEHGDHDDGHDEHDGHEPGGDAKDHKEHEEGHGEEGHGERDGDDGHEEEHDGHKDDHDEGHDEDTHKDGDRDAHAHEGEDEDAGSDSDAEPATAKGDEAS